MELTIQDLTAVVQVIDVVTARGALRGDELSTVGGLRDKVAAFVKAAQEQQNNSAPETEVEVNDAEVLPELEATNKKNKKVN